MKIVYFIKGLGLGGAERHVTDCAIALNEVGHDVRVAYLIPQKNHFVHQLENENIRVDLVQDSLYQIFRYLRNAQPDIVHAHLPMPALFSRLFKPFLRYNLVVTHHNVLSRQKPLVQLAERLLWRLDDIGISCSAEVSSSLPWHTVSIDNGIQIGSDVEQPKLTLRAKLGLSKNAVIILCVANLVPKKNHALLCRAFALARTRTDVDCHCVLIGQDGTERENLERLVDELGCKDCIHFWGADPNAAKLAADADIFCLASDFEGLPLALLEAMSVGLPSVVTDAGGMSSVVVDGTHGRVVPRGDLEGLSRALAELSDDSAMRAKFGERARNHIAINYSGKAMLDRLNAVYDSLMNVRDNK